MRLLLLAAFSLLWKISLPQGSIDLPRDNGLGVSFESQLPIVSGDPCPIECISSALIATKKTLWIRHSPKQGWLDGELLFSIKGHEVTCILEITSSVDSVSYQFCCYLIDGIRLDEWLQANPGVTAERIKSTIFAETVLAIVEIRKATS